MELFGPFTEVRVLQTPCWGPCYSMIGCCCCLLEPPQFVLWTSNQPTNLKGPPAGFRVHHAGWLVGWLAGWLVGWLVGGWLAGWLVGSKSKGQIGALQQAATTASNHGIAETPTWSLQDPYLSKRPKQLYAACSSLIHSFQNNRARRTSSCANKAIGM